MLDNEDRFANPSGGIGKLWFDASKRSPLRGDINDRYSPYLRDGRHREEHDNEPICLLLCC